ncbi:UDP-glucose/GDP-mannose dehydrogenase family protein [uncultured Ramlibacter sp.]|uniref:UDP-glucose dehydrogenase family protein n=1 Tax=uncultured Ramlibacter sp. TaxID=260755 RepID=UPI002637F06E|nr:UDP-glucose/GDP-mannose dehydrogenase family protein [uncultured Ramlibacter sp.]
MNLTVVGTGYVGLVTGACFAEMGNSVTCVDVDERKVEALKKGVIPIYEPGLEGIVVSNAAAGRLLFTTDLGEAMARSSLIFIAVGTPSGEDGSADLTHVKAVASQIGQRLTQRSVVVNKSTVPVGTGDLVRDAVQAELDRRGAKVEFDVVSNPEFLKEGAAVADFMSPDRIVIGSSTGWAREVMSDLYAPFVRNHPRIVHMSVRDAEMTKYAANAMLATKISFINEIANLCEHLGVDVENVRLGIGSDQRIGFHFIYPGAGYGGSCFPKDVKALVNMCEKQDFEPVVLRAVEQRNAEQKRVLFKKIEKRYGAQLTGKKVCVWGLSFKPGTDDMREAPSKPLIEALLAAGGTVVAFDPVAMEAARPLFAEEAFASGRLSFATDQYEAAERADLLVLVTEWKPFRHPDFSKLSQSMSGRVIFDGRNQYDPTQLAALGFEYHGIGREERGAAASIGA